MHAPVNTVSAIICFSQLGASLQRGKQEQNHLQHWNTYKRLYTINTSWNWKPVQFFSRRGAEWWCWGALETVIEHIFQLTTLFAIIWLFHLDVFGNSHRTHVPVPNSGQVVWTCWPSGSWWCRTRPGGSWGRLWLAGLHSHRIRTPRHPVHSLMGFRQPAFITNCLNAAFVRAKQNRKLMTAALMASTLGTVMQKSPFISPFCLSVCLSPLFPFSFFFSSFSVLSPQALSLSESLSLSSVLHVFLWPFRPCLFDYTHSHLHFLVQFYPLKNTHEWVDQHTYCLCVTTKPTVITHNIIIWYWSKLHSEMLSKVTFIKILHMISLQILWRNSVFSLQLAQTFRIVHT